MEKNASYQTFIAEEKSRTVSVARDLWKASEVLLLQIFAFFFAAILILPTFSSALVAPRISDLLLVLVLIIVGITLGLRIRN